jgi:hypothetical protein
MARAVTIVNSGGIPITDLASLTGLGEPMTPVDSGGVAVTLVNSGGYPAVLVKNDGTLYGLLASATLQLGGIAPYHYWDFLNNRALFASADVGAVTSTPGWSYIRADAQSAYAETSAGVLVPFATGVLRRTDRGVLIEGARTNLLLRSQEFDNASWTQSNATVSANSVVAPDGTTTADTLTENGSAAEHRVIQAVTTTAAAYTTSVYWKPNGRTWMHIRMVDSGSATRYAFFNCSGAGTVGTLGTGMTGTIAALNNGWYRVAVTIAAAFAGSNQQIFGTASADGISSYTGDGVSGAYMWGAQCELGAFASSYIPTTTASATRAADVLTVSSPGVTYPLSLFAEFERVVDTAGSEGLFRVDDTTANNSARLFVDSADRFQAGQFSDGASPVTGTLNLLTTYKGAARFASNDLRACSFATLGTNDTTATLPASPTRIIFGNSAETLANPQWGYLRRCAIVNSAVNDAGLTAMTT